MIRNLLLAVIVLCFLLGGCFKEDFVTDSGSMLEFSLDTLTFDTVFTERGSATRYFKVFNRHNKYIRITRVWIEGTPSFFRMNVDGIPGIQVHDVEVPPNDSIYIFVEVTIDPDQPLSVSPFVVNDIMQFETNGNRQNVILQAWGQNANYIPNRFFKGRQGYVSCDLNEWIWEDPRPYVLFGALLIDSCTLVLPPGTRLFFHGGIARDNSGSYYSDGIIYFFKHGKLQIEGTTDRPVIIQGDRLEAEYDDIPGQWGRIQLGPQSGEHSINHAIIKNAGIGILVDSLAKLRIRNTQIYNSSSSALAGYRADIVAENCLFHTSGGNNVTIILGGNYQFTYCTLANFGTATEALRITNFTCLDGTPICSQPLAARLNLVFKNSIIFGSGRDEIVLQDAVGEQDPSFFNYRFDYCIVKVDDLLSNDAHPDFFDFCDPCINGDRGSSLFIDVDNRDFHLDSLSIAQGAGIPVMGIDTDLDGVLRDPEQPDIGCYEFAN